MADGDKTLEATPFRKEKARREGNIPRSTEVVGTVAFVAAVIGTFAVLPMLDNAARVAIRAGARGDAGPAIRVMMLALLPISFAAAAGVLIALAQTRGIRMVAIKLDASRLSPGNGCKRMVSREAVVAAVRGLVAFGVAALALFPAVRELFGAASQTGGVERMATLAGGAASRSIYTVACVGAVFAGADYVLVHRKWLRDLRMSHDEIKREFKEHEGDPMARGRRKAMHRALVRGSLTRVKDASFVVTNPTHIAIALKYAPPEVPVPEMLVRAVDNGAQEVKALARSYGIPVIENVPLARALFAEGDVGRPIPATTYLAVAQVIDSLNRAGILT